MIYYTIFENKNLYSVSQLVSDNEVNKIIFFLVVANHQIKHHAKSETVSELGVNSLIIPCCIPCAAHMNSKPTFSFIHL